MSNELILALSNEVERNDRYNSPPSVLSTPGQADRRHEAEHVVAVRDEERRARELLVAAAVEAAGDISWIEGRAKVNTEAKYKLARAAKESQVLADSNPELQAEFGILDTEFFQQTRGRANRPRPMSGLFS